MIVPALVQARSKCPHCEGHEQRLVLHDLTWQDYQTISRVLVDRPKLRLTYDRGTLEFMTTSNEHELYKAWLARLFDVLADECNLPLVYGGSMTYEREDAERGFEPDESYWIAHAEQRRGRMVWDPAVDPPPDLIFEIKVSRSSQDRMGIFAHFGVPEVWCFDAAYVRVYVLQADRSYRQVEQSPTFPTLPLEGLVPFLQPQQGQYLRDTIRAFRAWVREQLAKNA